MAKSLLEQYEDWKLKKQKEEQQASQPKYTIPDTGSILEQYQSYKQQRQAEEQKAASAKRINNPSHLGNVMIAGAVQNTQKKQAEAGRIAKEEEARWVKQEEKQSWNDYVQRLTDQYMPVRPDPIPQVDINKKYGPVSELTKRGATIASSSVSDAPFGFGKIIDLSGDGGSMSVRNSAMEEADRDRREREERDRADREAYQAALERLNLGRGGKLNESSGRGGDLNLPSTGRGGALENSNGRGGRIVSDKVALEGALETADRERAEFAQRDMQGTKEREAVLERNLSVEDLQAKRAAAEKDIEQYNKVLEWVPSPQNVEAYQNYLAAQTQKKAAQEGIEQIDTFTLIKQLKDQASKETDPFELADINSKLQAAEYKYKWSTMDPEERAKTWVWQRVERGFRNFNRAYYGLTTDFIADILGIDRSEVSKQNQKQLDVINKEIAYQAQSASAIEGRMGDILTMLVENLPNAAMSLMGGGGLGIAASAAMDLKTASAPFVTKFIDSFAKMVKNPMFWNSFMRAAGSNYIDEHDIKGNDPIISVTAASIKGFLDASIEVGGGIETGEIKPLGPASIIQSGFEEMGEELFQGPVSNAYDFSQSGKGADTKLEDIVSWDNPNAIISGKQMAQEGIMGFAGGVALSGMQQAGVAAVGAVKGQDLSAEPRSEYNYPEANIDKQIANKEAEIAKKESEAYENATRERMDFETRDGEAAKKYSELVKMVNESFPEESETKAKIAEATTIGTKRMTEIATNAMQELRARMQAEPTPETLKLSEALTQTVEGIFAGMQTDRNAITDKYTAGLDEGLKAEIKGKNDADYAKGYGIAHALGQMGVPVDTIAKVKSVSTLQETAQEAAQQGQAKWEAALPQLKAKAADLQKALPKPGQGGVTYRANVKQEALSTLQRDQIGLLEKIAKPLGYNFVMMEFDKDAQGNYVTDKGQIAPNGFFRDSDGTIYIDVNAGKTVGRMVEDTIIPLTAGHELGHYLKATSPELFRAYSAAVVEELVSKGTDIDALIAKQIGRGKLREITVESAIEEMIMESGAMMLSNSQAAQKMAETNPGLFQKIAEWVKDFVDSIRKAFSRVDATPEAKAIMQTVNGALKYSDTIINLWDTMAVTEAQGRADVKPATVARRDVQAVAKEAAAASERDTLKFQMREPVEETAKLIAVHNLSEAQLLSSVELGGFAMPSIAVIRAGQPHDRYGDISIVFGKETIDPENYGNKVYGGDAWTPSFPNIDYEISETAAQAVRKKASELLGPYYKDMRPGLDDDNMQDVINRAGGDPVKAYEDNTALKAAYLRDIGENFTPRYSEPDYGSEFGNDVVKYVADRMGDKVKEALSGDRKQFMSIEPDVRKALNERDNGKFGGDMYSQPFGFGQVDRLARAVAQYINSNGVTRFDVTETSRDIREAMKEGNHEAGYKAWLKNMFGGIVSKSGIRNNAEFFTPSGNRRSFDALHWSVTLENVVRSMKSQDGKGVDSMGGGGLFGVSTKNYNSLDDIRKDVDRLQLMDEEQYQTKKDEFRDRIIELADEIAPKSERNRFTALDRASEVLTEAARKGTTAGIQRVLNGYKDYYNIREDTAKKLYKLMSDISRMPTEYFEAKPERAVGFDEVRAVIIPDTASDALKKALDNVSAPVIEYKADDNTDRLKALNSPELDGVKFQERDTQYLAAVEAGDMDTAQKMVDEAAKAAGYTIKAYHGTPNYQVNKQFGTSIADIHKLLYPNEKTLNPDAETFSDEYNRFWKFERWLKNNVDKTNVIPDNLKYLFKKGVTEPFTVFDKSRSGESTGAYDARRGFFFTEDEAFANRFRNAYSYDRFTGVVTKKTSGEGTLLSVYIKPGNVLDLTKERSADASKLRQMSDDITGYDTVINKVKWNPDLQKQKTRVTTEIMVTNPSNIKLTSPVTYDDSGNPIPLSQRFTDSNDIRFQERDSDNTPLSPEQIEYFKDSKVRDEQGRLLKVYHGTEKAGFHEFSESDDIGYFFTSSSRLASTYSGTYKDYAPARIDTWEQAKAYAEKNNIDFEENDDEYIIDGDTFVEEELKFAEDLLNELTAESSTNYNVYLNLKDPYIIDAGGSNWSAVIEQSGTMKTFSELTKTEKKRISDNMGIEVGELYDITDNYGNSLAAFDVDNFYFYYPRTTREIVQEAVDMGADGVIIRNVEDGGKYSYGGDTGDVYVALNPEQIKSTANLTPTSSPDIRYQERDPVPAMYSKMAQEIEAYKGDKLGADSVVKYLQGRGVKADEIRWSGIVPFLQGKKSVSKAELLEFAKGNELRVEDITLSSDPDKTKFGKYALPDGEDYHELLFTAPELSGTFQSAHFDEKNVLAHTRLQDFQTPGGKPVLFVEEVQSDWHEKGREEGYVTKEESEAIAQKISELKKTEGRLKTRLQKIIDYVNKEYSISLNRDSIYYAGITAWTKTKDDWNKLKDYEKDEFIKTNQELKDTKNEIDRLESGTWRIPEAPFTTTWHEYVLKRVLRMAAEGGYDYVGWTTGQMQADRYSLEKVLSELTAIKRTDGTYFITAKGKDGQYLTEDRVSVTKLPSVVGKEMARKIVGGDNVDTAFEAPAIKEWTTKQHFEGLDLKVGGEGMKAFYDIGGKSSQNIPRFLNKYGAQWGAKISTIDMQGAENTYQVPAIEVTDAMKESVLYEGQALYQERDPDYRTKRDILAGAFDSVAQTEGEKRNLKEYKNLIGSMNRMEEEARGLRQANTAEWKKAEPDRAKVNENKKRIFEIEKRIFSMDKKLIQMQNAAPLRNVLIRQKREFERTAVDKYKGKRDTNELNDALDLRADRAAKRLMKYALTPDKNSHVPDGMRTDITNLLTALDLASEDKAGNARDSYRARSWQEALTALGIRMKNADMVAATTKGNDEAGPALLVDPALQDKIESLIKRNDGVVRYRNLKTKEKQTVVEILESVSVAVSEANKKFSADRTKTISDVADKTIDYAKAQREKKLRGEIAERLSTFLNIDMADAFTFFDSLGEGGQEILKGLYNEGFSKLVRNTEDARAFFDGLNAKYGKYGMSTWGGKNATPKNFKVASGTLTMTPAQIMELYMLNKREQARGHIYGQGIRVERIRSRKPGKAAVLWQKDALTVTPAEIEAITSTLTEQQKQVAEEFGAFFGRTSTKWGNEVSMTLYGYYKFIEQNYYPIHSDTNFTMTQDPNSADMLYALLNIGATKDTVKFANNPIIISDIFDTVTRHITDMANYNAFAPALVDAMKWFNYKRIVKDEAGNMRLESVKGGIERMMGAAGKNYVINLLKAVNGIKNPQVASGFAGMVNSAIGKFKTSAVGANARVVLQQHASYVRGSALLSPAAMTAAYFRSPRRGMQMARKYSAIAAWKHMGYFDMNIGRQMSDLINGNESTAEKIRQAAMKPAGLADDFTIGVLWNAAEIELGKTYKGDKRSEEFYKLVGEKLTEVIDRTQVVDTVFHRSQIMRDKDGLTKIATNFMSEPIKTYNLLMSAVKTGDLKTIARTGTVALLSYVVVAMAAGFSDAARDKDKEKGWQGYWESWMKNVFGIGGSFLESNVWDNMNPLNMIPFGKDVYGLATGYSPSRPDLQAAQRMIWAANDWMKLFNGENKDLYKLIYNTANAVSTASGIPISNVMRDVKALYDTLDPRVVVGDNTKVVYQRFSNALANGEEDKALAYYNALIDSGRDSVTIRTQAMQRYKDEETVIAAAEAKKAGDFTAYEKAIDQAVKDGIPRDMAIKAADGLSTEKAEKVKPERAKTIDEVKKAMDYKDAYTYESNDLMVVIEKGDNVAAKKIIDKMLKEGRKKDAISGNISTYFKPIYLEAYKKGRASNLKANLLTMYALLGYDRDKKSKDIDAWLK